MKDTPIDGISSQPFGAGTEPARTPRHRGRHPSDLEQFTGCRLDSLAAAVSELSWLLTRGYAVASALKLVGDRHALTQRQRLAIGRAACADEQKAGRLARCISVADLRGEVVAIDGFNLIITLEAALGHGLLLHCRDGCVRDLSSVHGSYRSVEETDAALEMVGMELAAVGPAKVTWFLDQPVSNSGRLAERIRELAARRNWPWTAEVVMNPDPVLAASEAVVVSSDSVVLNRCRRWTNLAAWLIQRRLPEAFLVELSGSLTPPPERHP